MERNLVWFGGTGGTQQYYTNASNESLTVCIDNNKSN